MDKQLGEKISVCLLTYNHVNVVESTLRSILKQTIYGYEIIVSDDCSTDGTWEMILSLAKKDARIRPVRTPKNMGMAGNANFAVSHSSRPYVALLHHDDIYREDMLEKWSAIMDKYHDVAFVFNAYAVPSTDFVYREMSLSERTGGESFLVNYLFPRWGSPVRGTAMIRRSSWMEIGGMRESYSLLADIDLWMRLSRKWAVGYCKEPIVVVRDVRPDYYPEIYKGTCWSWERQRILYEIHAVNRLAFCDLLTAQGKVRWFWFRFRLTVDILRSVLHLLLRGKTAFLKGCTGSITKYEMWWGVLIQKLILSLVCSFESKAPQGAV